MVTGSRGSSASVGGNRRYSGAAAASSGAGEGVDAMDDDYVLIDGSSIGARAAAALAQQQSPSPTRCNLCFSIRQIDFVTANSEILIRACCIFGKIMYMLY